MRMLGPVAVSQAGVSYVDLAALPDGRFLVADSARQVRQEGRGQGGANLVQCWSPQPFQIRP